MEHRYLKIALTLSVALLALFYAAHNLANWSAAQAAVGYVLGQQDHAAYPNSLVPAIGSPVAVTGALIAICLGEFTAGACALVGAYRLWSARKAAASEFAAAKRLAVIGSGLAGLVWFLLFAVLGGALFQMWQTQAGAHSLEGAFQFSGLSLLTLIYTSLPEPGPADGPGQV